MYIIRKTLPNGQRGFKTHDGWVRVKKRVALDLSDVIRFTEREKELNELPLGSEFVYFGCYKELEDV